MEHGFLLCREEEIRRPHIVNELGVDGERVSCVRVREASVVPGLPEVYIHTVLLQ